MLTAKTYLTLLASRFGADMPPEVHEAIRASLAEVTPGTETVDVMMRRGVVASHGEWIGADRARIGLAAAWRRLFAEFDVVLCPISPTPAFPHDHSDMGTRTIEIDGTAYPYDHHVLWPSVATLTGLPSTAAPIGRSPEGLPYGMQIVGPYLEDRTPLRFAELIEREFGGFTPPPGFA